MGTSEEFFFNFFFFDEGENIFFSFDEEGITTLTLPLPWPDWVIPGVFGRMVS